jgi:hypothetical protein
MIQIDKHKFRQAHRAFLRQMESKGGVPFTSFGHIFLVKNEISYKHEALRRASEVICFAKWKAWQKQPGRIVAALKEACKPSVSNNLLEHRYGEQKGSYKALYRLEDDAEVRGFEQEVVALYEAIRAPDHVLGPQFDAFAEHLRKCHLGCNWDFVAYLLFLMRPERFFPIRSSRFGRVLTFYGVTGEFEGKVTWDRYKLLLDVAEALKEELAVYGTPDAIQLQSYMWVVSYLIPKLGPEEDSEEIDFVVELRERQQRQAEHVRIGMLGEQYVYQAERTALQVAGKDELAQQVRLVSAENDGAGYDVLSFALDGWERHIEVKATSQSPSDFDQFWLTENEVQQALTDPNWTLCRVWRVDSDPFHDDLGNIVTSPKAGWERQPASWVVRKKLGTSPDSWGGSPTTKTFSGKKIAELRRRAIDAAQFPEDSPAGWSISTADPMAVLAAFEPLRIKPGFILRAYQFREGGNGNAFVWALPADAEFPEPADCPRLEDEFLSPPKPPAALDDLMDVIEGDGTPWSFLCASLFCREIHEFGAAWHGCDWSTHTILDCNPLSTRRARRETGLGIPSGEPEQWTWAEPEPADWKPHVVEDADGVSVVFFTFSGLGTETIFRQTDRFARGTCRFTTDRKEIATGPGGFVF